MSASVDAGQKSCDLAALRAEYREPYWRDRCERALVPYRERPLSVGNFCGIPLEAFTRDELLTVLYVLGTTNSGCTTSTWRRWICFAQ